MSNIELVLQDTKRLAALQQLNLLDNSAEEGFDRLTRLAAKIIGAPVSFISLVGSDRQYFKSFVGLPKPLATTRELPLSHSICKHTVATGAPLIISDAREVAFLRDNQAISDLNVIAYLGLPLCTSTGEALGSFCVIDTKPRQWTESEIEILRELTESVMVEIELRGEIMARKVAEQALKVAKEQAELAAEVKSRFTATITHELRTPLNIILGIAQLMGRDQQLSDTHKDNINLVLQSGEHLLGLINDVLEISRIEANNLALEEINFDLYQLLHYLRDMFQTYADHKNLAFSIETKPDLVQYVRGDMRKLRQILLNLINNTVKFTRSGKVVIAAGHTQTTDGTILLTFEIQDIGLGIAEEELSALFLPFAQADSDHQLQDGAGLGLSIVSEYVRLMGGKVEVRSYPNQATTFRLSIPMQPGYHHRPAVSYVREERQIIGLVPGEQTYRILVVDDKRHSRNLLVSLLEMVGFEVKGACNGEEAIEGWQAWRPHLIWMDMRMPVMNGYEATRHIKAQPGGAETVIVALTASALDVSRRKIFAAGCDDFIAKPYRESDIFDKMAQYLGVRYQYEPSKLPPQGVPTPSVHHLPADLQDALLQAATAASQPRVKSLSSSLNRHNPALAQQITQLADDFHFDRILELFKA